MTGQPASTFKKYTIKELKQTLRSVPSKYENRRRNVSLKRSGKFHGTSCPCSRCKSGELKALTKAKARARERQEPAKSSRTRRREVDLLA